MTKYDLFQKYLSFLDHEFKWWSLYDSEYKRSTTYRKVINAIPNKYIEYIDSILINSEGIWIYLKEEYDFNDCGCCGGTCHVDTLKQIKEQFSYGVIPRWEKTTMIINLDGFAIAIVNKSTGEKWECRQVVSVTINQSTFDSHIGYTITAVVDLPKYAAENINLNRPNYEISLIYQDKIQPATFKHVAALAGKYTFLFD